MKVYAVVNVWHDDLFGGCETSIVSPPPPPPPPPEKHMFSRCDEDDRIREYELKDKFEEEME